MGSLSLGGRHKGERAVPEALAIFLNRLPTVEMVGYLLPSHFVGLYFRECPVSSTQT